MFNLVEVQTALQSPSVQLADLMKYANGSSAEVPAYLALGELNRRKQLEATNTAFNATPPTVKDQLTNAPPAVNPTAAPQGIAPTATPPQLAATTAAPPRMNVAAAPANQVAPTAPAPSMMAAEGGLMSIPTPHMFKQESYATGGIVAFEEGGKTDMNPPLNDEQKSRRDELEAIKYLDEAKVAKDKPDMETWKRGVAQTTDEFNALRAQRQAGEENPEAAKIIADAKAAKELQTLGPTRTGISQPQTDNPIQPKSIYRPANNDESVQSIAHPKELQGLESLEKVNIPSQVESNQPRLVSRGTPAVAGTNSLASALSNAATQINAQKDAEIAKVRENGRLNNENADNIQFSIDKINNNALAKINGLGAAGGTGTTTGGKAATKDIYETQAQADARVANAGEAGGIPDAIKAGRVAPPVAAPVAPVAAPIAAPTGIAPTAPAKSIAHTQEETQNDELKQLELDKTLRSKAGISEDPHKATRERLEKLEAKRAGQEAEDPFNSLMARLTAFGTSKQHTFGGGMGESALAGDKYRKETEALRDKQATEMIAARQAMETADDARARGDLATAKAATEQRYKHEEKAKEIEAQVQHAAAATSQATTAAALVPSHNVIASAHMLSAQAAWEKAKAEGRLAGKGPAELQIIRGIMEDPKNKNKDGSPFSFTEAARESRRIQHADQGDISDERNLSRERLKANTDWENPMTVTNARKLYGKDLPLPQLKAKFMDGRLSSLPGYTPESGTPTTEAEYDKLPKGALYTDPNGVPRNKS